MLPATHSQRLWQKIRLAEPPMYAASDRFWNDDQVRSLYPHFLVQLYHVVVGGLRLMSFAAQQAASMPSDPVATMAAEYLLHHIEEEKDHADWLLDDLRILGIDAVAVAASRPLPSVVSLLGEQFYWVSSFHPVVVFGYLLVLEGSPPIVSQLEQIQSRSGLPREAFRCLRAHAEDDPAHLEDLNRTLDRMPLTPDQERRLALGAFQTVEAVSTLLGELLRAGSAPAATTEYALVGHG